MKQTELNLTTLENWLWDAACEIRGATDAPKYKDFILPLIFFKRLSDVYDDEFAQLMTVYGDEALAQYMIEADHKALEQNPQRKNDPLFTPIIRFYIPKEYAWSTIRHHTREGNKLGEFVTTALRSVAQHNRELKGVLDVKDYNEQHQAQRVLDDEHLGALIEVISRQRLGLKDTQADMLGRAYEYLLRKFAEGQGQSAGEFFTPIEVGWLMAKILNPVPLSTVYDPTCGAGGLLIKARMLFEENHPNQKTQAPRLYGQELNPVTFAMAKMNMFLHDYVDSDFQIGDTLRKPAFQEIDNSIKRFDYVVANPMWNQKHYKEEFYNAEKRFEFGTPPSNSADWAWVQHIYASLKPHAQAAIVLDTGAVSRGSGSKNSHKERDIRKQFVEKDLIECVILLPENLFYNTTAPGIILILNRQKRREGILLINASEHFVQEKPKNVLTETAINAVAGVYQQWETREKLSRVVSLEEIREADYNLSPSQFVQVTEAVSHRSLLEILTDLQAARLAREAADSELARVLAKLGLNGRNVV